MYSDQDLIVVCLFSCVYSPPGRGNDGIGDAAVRSGPFRNSYELSGNAFVVGRAELQEGSSDGVAAPGGGPW